jgi:hypothetical protein
MKRTPLQRKTPMKRSGWKSSPTDSKDWRSDLRANPKKGMRSRPKRVTVAEGSKYLEACRGESCYLRIAGICCSNGWAHESVVPCHSNQSKHGKGAGLKADHKFTIPGCMFCHQWLDQGIASREIKVRNFDLAYAEWEPVRARKLGIEIEQQEMEAA